MVTTFVKNIIYIYLQCVTEHQLDLSTMNLVLD